MPTLMDGVLAWCLLERTHLQQQLDLLRRGIMRTGERRSGSPERDTTAESIERVRNSLAELDEILAERTRACETHEERRARAG